MRKKNKHSPSPALKSSTSMIKKESAVTLTKTARKSRSKTRKPKYLSLRLQISPETTAEMPTDGGDCDRRHQLDLFPLHPENLVEEKENHDENVAYFFSAEDGGATTLTGLLGADTSSSACDLDNNAASLSPESLTYAYRRQDSEEVEQLVRTAMRNKAREASEEKWVSCCSTPVSNEKKENQRRRLSLKLDYQEIMDAWSDKGPLYIGVDSSPQVVPDLGDDDLFGNPSTNGWGSSGGGLWTVPEMSGSNSNGCIKLEEVHEDWKIGKREASVLRYKEKRQNRLFSKKIRYEVRKLNAEKRPRIKGRFVKRI